MLENFYSHSHEITCQLSSLITHTSPEDALEVGECLYENENTVFKIALTKERKILNSCLKFLFFYVDALKLFEDLIGNVILAVVAISMRTLQKMFRNRFLNHRYFTCDRRTALY